MSPTFTDYQPDAIAVSAATHCSTIQHTATHCNNTSIIYVTPLLSLREPVFTDNQQGNCSHCNNTLQHTLQHTATTCCCSVSLYSQITSKATAATATTHCNTRYNTLQQHVQSPASCRCLPLRELMQRDLSIRTTFTDCQPGAIAVSSAKNCNTIQHTATRYNILQHNTTYCNIIQHTATAFQSPARRHCCLCVSALALASTAGSLPNKRAKFQTCVCECVCVCVYVCVC